MGDEVSAEEVREIDDEQLGNSSPEPFDYVASDAMRKFEFFLNIKFSIYNIMNLKVDIYRLL